MSINMKWFTFMLIGVLLPVGGAWFSSPHPQSFMLGSMIFGLVFLGMLVFLNDEEAMGVERLTMIACLREASKFGHSPSTATLKSLNIPDNGEMFAFTFDVDVTIEEDVKYIGGIFTSSFSTTKRPVYKKGKFYLMGKKDSEDLVKVQLSSGNFLIPFEVLDELKMLCLRGLEGKYLNVKGTDGGFSFLIDKNTAESLAWNIFVTQGIEYGAEWINKNHSEWEKWCIGMGP